MGNLNPFDEVSLAAQIRHQKRFAWDLEKSIPWGTGIQSAKPLLPLDRDSIAFPGASAEQRLALSQFVGLLINNTISEMESVIHKLRDTAWERALRTYPVNPEMRELGYLFFEEELKHSLAFSRYNEAFCKEVGIDKEALDQILPKAWGSLFLKAIIANARSGGSAFWWVVATVEEVSIEIYRELAQWKDSVDPLFLIIHKRHLEEEARHRNYAFLMLDVLHEGRSSFRGRIHARTDLLLAQTLTTGWVVSELHKSLQVAKLADSNPFFKVVASCLPLMDKVSFFELAKRLFVSAPYLSVLLNTRHHQRTMELARERGALRFPLPQPKLSSTVIEPL